MLGILAKPCLQSLRRELENDSSRFWTIGSRQQGSLHSWDCLVSSRLPNLDAYHRIGLFSLTVPLIMREARGALVMLCRSCKSELGQRQSLC